MTDTVTLPPPLAAFVQAQVASGEFPDAEAVVAEALGMLREEIEEEQALIDEFNREVQIGIDAMERGEVIHVTDVKAWLDTLGRD